MNGRSLATMTSTGVVAPTTFFVEDGVITAMTEADGVESGLLATPGFVDLQINGGFGHDFTSAPETFWAVAAELPAHGVTSFLPTIISASDETYEEAVGILRAGPPHDFAGATPLGLHAEGPFLAPERCGAHERRHIRPPGERRPSWLEAPELRMLTLAPEVEGATELARELSARGVLVSAGHSNCDDALAREAFASGIRYGTHVFNAMSGIAHRAPGLATALLRDERVVAGAIVDGIHLHPAIVDLVYRAKGARGMSLVSDAAAAAGMPDGAYALGGQEIVVEGGAVRLADGTLAGSALTLDVALRNLVAYTGCTLTEAALTVTETPGRLLGGSAGRLIPGAPADVTILNTAGEVVECWVRGARLA